MSARAMPSASPGEGAGAVEGALGQLRDRRVVERLWEEDYTVRGPEPDEIADRLGFGSGPRFLHSTGELHKGDGGHEEDASLPEEAVPDETGGDYASITFRALEAAQALGDRVALPDAGVIGVHLHTDVRENPRRLAASI